MIRKALIILAVLLALASCGNPWHGSGYIVGRHYSAPYSYWVSGVDVPGTCTGGKYPSCSSGVHVPGHMQYVEAEWTLKVRDNDGHVHSVAVDSSVYDRCQTDWSYNTETAACAAR